MVCDTIAFDSVSEAIIQLKKEVNAITKFKTYNVE